MINAGAEKRVPEGLPQGAVQSCHVCPQVMTAKVKLVKEATEQILHSIILFSL
jgi:hypothetical protein